MSKEKYQEALDEIGMQVNKAYIDSCYEKATKQSMRKVEDIVGVNIKILKELVDRATPKKPIEDEIHRDYMNCVCGHYVGDKRLKRIQSKFCPRCGQLQDWSGEDE